MCSIWSLSLTDLTIDSFGEDDCGSVEDQIEALTSLCVLERLTLSTQYGSPKDDDLMKLATHPNLPVTLTNVSWNWNTIIEGRQRDGVHNKVRQSFASRGIMCHNIDEHCRSLNVKITYPSTHDY
jgi:hypothetical protein